MVAHFNSMCKEDSIPHFDIRYASQGVMVFFRNVKRDHINAIHPALIPFLKEESTTNKLFDPSNWSPYRAKKTDAPSYLAYNKLFVYKQYFFQVALCADCSACQNAQTSDCIHFELALFGWLTDFNDRFICKETGTITEYISPLCMIRNRMVPAESEHDWNKE